MDEGIGGNMNKVNRSPQIDQQEGLVGDMSFGSAMNAVLNGERVRRADWEDEEVYLTMRDEQLMIFKTEDKLLHPLTISGGDIAGTDWVVMKRIELVH